MLFFLKTKYYICHFNLSLNIQGVIEMRAQILTTNYWLHVELGKNI
jgi:hypothetical protein